MSLHLDDIEEQMKRERRFGFRWGQINGFFIGVTVTCIIVLILLHMLGGNC